MWKLCVCSTILSFLLLPPTPSRAWGKGILLNSGTRIVGEEIGEDGEANPVELTLAEPRFLVEREDVDQYNACRLDLLACEQRDRECPSCPGGTVTARPFPLPFPVLEITAITIGLITGVLAGIAISR